LQEPLTDVRGSSFFYTVTAKREIVIARHLETDEIEFAANASLASGYEDRRNPISAITTHAGYTLVVLAQTSTHEPRWNVALLRLLRRIASAGISIELLQSHATLVRFLAPTARIESVREIALDLGLTFHGKPGCAKVCIIGTGVRTTPGVLHRALSTLVESGVSVPHWADSNVTLSFVVEDEYASRSEDALRAAFGPEGDALADAAFSFDADLGLLRINGREVKLGVRQAQLFRYFLDNVGRILPIEELSRHLFGVDHAKHYATVRVHLHNLRKKIEPNVETAQHLVTVPEQGYVFVR
jgi:hypothetical protein